MQYHEHHGYELFAMSTDLADRLRSATRNAHRAVERSATMQAFLRGRFDRLGYCRLLRNLHEIYAALEPALTSNCRNPAIASIDIPEIRRLPSIIVDMRILHGENWQAEIAPHRAACIYADRIRELERTHPELLVAHAYVRYLGDLNGGTILRRIVADTLEIESGDGLGFYEFGINNQIELAQRFRDGLNAIEVRLELAEAIVNEALAGFRSHAALFEELGPDLGTIADAHPPAYLPRP